MARVKTRILLQGQRERERQQGGTTATTKHIYTDNVLNACFT